MKAIKKYQTESPNKMATKSPIDIDSAVKYQKLKCEEKPPSEREACYKVQLLEIEQAQEKRAVLKALRFGGIALSIIGILILIFYFAYVWRGKKLAAKKAAAAAAAVKSS